MSAHFQILFPSGSFAPFRVFRGLFIAIFLAAAIQSFAADLSTPLVAGPRVPDGFAIEKVADAPIIKFPMFACFDEKGRLFVAESSGGDLYKEISAQTRMCRVSVLEDRDRDGKYETARVYADHLNFPMGLAWRGGKLYVADPPDLVTYDDAGKREVILTGFGHKDNGSLHGLTFGLDGWLYMTTGEPDGYKLKRADGSVLQGESGALIRCRPDGSAVEVVSRGFINLVEIAFLPTGEIIGTDNWFQAPTGGQRDALVHLIEGGLYPYHPDKGTPQPITGAPLDAVEKFPAVALSGLMRYGANRFPAEMRGNLFSAQHNTRKVQRHVLTREGATWRSESFDFVTSDDPDFHPSDVLEARDGSMLVVDTGGWYVQHCPTGKIRASYATGGIYRVRYKMAQTGMSAALSKADAEATKVRVLGWRRDPRDAPKFARWLRSKAPQVRLAAAEALAHCGTVKELAAIWEALPRAVDRFEEHALIYAAHCIADDGKLKDALNHTHPRVQKAALLLLDQFPRKGIVSDLVIARLSAGDSELRETAIQVLQRHPEWAEQAIEFIRASMEKEDDPHKLSGLVLAFQSRPSVQKLVADAIADRALVPDRRVKLIETLALTSLPKLPSSWTSALGEAVRDANSSVRLAAVRAVATLHVKLFDDELATLAKNPGESIELRLEALRGIMLRQPDISEPVFNFLLGQLGNQSMASSRLAAFALLARAKLTDEQARRFQETTQGNTLLSRSATTEEQRGGDPSVSLRAKLEKFEPMLRGGNAARGREVFFSSKVACATCHRVGKEGGSIGPDLTKVGAIRSSRDLLESVLVPSSTFAQGYEPCVIATTEGDVFSGIIARQNESVVVVRDASGAETQLRRDQIRMIKKSDVSIMPEGLERGLTEQEFRDLIAFLEHLK